MCKGCTMKPLIILIAFLLLAFAVGAVSAQNANYTSNFSSLEVVRINQSFIHDPTDAQAAPWDLWVMSGIIGLILVVLALIKPRLYRMDYEINIILSVMAWPFLWYWTWGNLTSIDLIVGVAMAGANGEYGMITQHILYSFPILGGIGVAGDIAAIFITILLIGQFKLFKENEENQGEIHDKSGD